jgi:outer membrane protein
MNINRVLLFLFVFNQGISVSSAQSAQDTALVSPDINQCVQFALSHQPVVQQSLIDEKITETTIKSKLADWYPQLKFNYTLQHNFQLQTSIIGGNAVRLGVSNISIAQFNLSQQIFNRDVLFAMKTKNDVRTLSRQNTSASKIDIAANVSKAFYDVLATTQQIKVSRENIARIERSLQDAFNQYKAGVTDKTDYKRATIALNNTKAFLQSNLAILKAKKEYLKFLMGYPAEKDLEIAYDSLQMEKETGLDTLQQPDYTQRIEYRQLETQRKLLEANLKYERWSFLPTLDLTGNYNMNYLNESFDKLYSTNYPNSFALLNFSFPIFQGGKRKANIQGAGWKVERLKLDLQNLKNSVNSEYSQALAIYKSNHADYISLKENLDLAQEVYNIIQLQYKSGVKTYLEVINAETDLRTSQINYYNALYQLLAAKIDVERALGQINY